jgi:hypothetical protein
MTSWRLLRVRTSFADFEIKGPVQSRRGSVGRGESTAARLVVTSTSGTVDVTWADTEGNEHTGTNEREGPSFFEDTTYRLWVKSLIPGMVPAVLHRDPYLLQSVDTYPDENVCTGPVNFRRQVGLSDLEVRIGHETVKVTIEVFPVKLDYERDYMALLSDVASAARGLALEYLRATYRSGAAHDADYATSLEWLTLLRNQIDALQKSIQYINAHPHRSLTREIEDTKLEKIKRADSSIRRAIIRGRGHGPWIHAKGVGRIRGIIPAVKNQETLDTPEHRWLCINLTSVRDRLTDLHASVVAEVARYERQNRPTPKRLLYEEKELSGFIGVIKRLLALPVFDGVQGVPPPGFASLTLLSGTGYGDAYRSLMVLRLGLDVSGPSFDLSTMDVHDLYETWCFIEISRQVASITGHIKNFGTLLQIEEAGIRVRLRRGEHSAITYAGTSKTIVVSYNPQYPGLTGNQRPDITLRIQHDGWPELVVVFDAKYRLDASKEYRQRFDTAGPPLDAINSLHRYRDAIVIDSVGRGLLRPVVKGAALFPLSKIDTQDYASSRLSLALDVLGIGALPFLPNNTDHVEKWLKLLIALPPEDLAEPGPQFVGLSEKYRRV